MYLSPFYRLQALDTRISEAVAYLESDNPRHPPKGARLAADCGKAGADRLVGYLRTSLRSRDYCAPLFIECLKALEKQGLFAASALAEISHHCKIRSNFLQSIDVTHQAIHTLGVIGDLVLRDTNEWWLANLTEALPSLLDEKEQAPHNQMLRLRVFGELGERAINFRKDPVDDFFLENFEKIKKFYDQSKYPSVRNEVVKTVQIISQALNDSLGIEMLHQPASRFVPPSP